MPTRTLLSTLWIFVLFNMIFADIVGFIYPGTLQDIIDGDFGFEVTPSLLLIFAIMLEIPIAMTLLSRLLERRHNRIANFIAAPLTILFVIGGGSATAPYIFFAGIEVLALIGILSIARRWPDGQGR